MTDEQKLHVIDAIVAQMFEYKPTAENTGAFFEGLMLAIFAVLMMDGDDDA